LFLVVFFVTGFQSGQLARQVCLHLIRIAGQEQRAFLAASREQNETEEKGD